MREKILSILKVLLFLSIGGFLFWLVIKDQNIDLIREKLREADWRWAALSLIFGFISNIFRALRWNMLIQPLGDRPKPVNTFGAVMVGYMANLALPKLGEFTRCVILNRYEKTPVNKLFGTVITERIIDVSTIFFLLFVVVLLEFTKMSAFSIQYVFNPLGEKMNVFLAHNTLYYLVIVVALAFLFLFSWFVIIRFRESKYFIKLRDIVRGFVTGIKTVSQLENRTLFLVYTAIIWGMYLLMAYATFFCFSATSSLGMVAALAVMVFGGFGWAAPVQGGFGTYHIIVTQALILFGIAQDDGLAFAILSHATQVFGMLSFGLISLLLLPIINRKSKSAIQTTPV